MRSASKKLRIVLDTNIYVSAFLFPGGNPEKIIKIALNQEIEIYVSDFILKEFKKVLVEKFKYSRNKTTEFIKSIAGLTKKSLPKQRLNIIRDHKADNQILSCALSAKADYLITGDKKHILPLKQIQQTKILSAEGFLKVFYK